MAAAGSKPAPRAAQQAAPAAPQPWLPPPQMQPMTPAQSAPMPLPPKTSGMAVASMVLGIVALCIFSVGLLTGPIALVLGFLAINGINREPDRFKGKGMAIAGVVLGSIVVVLWLIIIIMIATGAIDIKQILECSSNPNAKGCPGA